VNHLQTPSNDKKILWSEGKYMISTFSSSKIRISHYWVVVVSIARSFDWDFFSLGTNSIGKE